MSNVLIDRQKIDILANAISDKSDVPVTMTLDEMIEAVDSIEAGSAAPTLQAKTYTVDSAGTETITADGGYDGLSEVEVVMPELISYDIIVDTTFSTVNNQRKYETGAVLIPYEDGFLGKFLNGVYVKLASTTGNAVPANTTITPTESVQTIGGAYYMMAGAVTVNAIPSTYVGSGITQRSSSDLTASGATVTVPSGYYTSNASKAVASGTAGTPTATKGAVSNHQVSVTPSVTNTTGYITGSTKTGTAVTVSASELVSGTYIVDSSGTKDVTNYASASVPAMGNPTWGSTHSGTDKGDIGLQTYDQYFNIPSGYNDSATYYTIPAVDVVTKNITANGTYSAAVDGHMGYSSVTVNVQGGGGTPMQRAVIAEQSSMTSSSLTFTGLQGEPKSFIVILDEDTSTSSPATVAAVVFDGTDLHGQTLSTTANANASYDTGFTKSYSNGTLIITATTAQFKQSAYSLFYTYGGGSIDTKDVQIGSGATSITFTGLEDEPIWWSCIFKSNFGTSSGYQRVIYTAINTNDGVFGMALDSSGHTGAYWTASYNNGSLTITSQGTNQGGYFHQPGYYQLTYAYDSSGNYQSKTVTPTTSQQVITADTGYEALKRVTVNAMPTGTAGTPTATKGSRVGNSITVTPTVTNTAGYISGGTLTGTGVSVSASEVTNGTYSITADGTYNIANYASVSVNVGGGGDTPEPSNINVGTATRTLTSAASSISFTGLSGEPTSFAVCTSAGLSTGASPWKTAMVVYDGSMVQGDFITNTNNQQLATSTSTTYSSITFGKSYSNGTLTITGSGSNFQANEYTLVYTYNGSTSDVQTKTQTVGSGATSITFSGLSGTPKYFACIFEGTAGYYSTSSGYQRVIGVVYNGTSTYGVSMGSGAVASTTAWTYTYNNGSLTITSAGTNNGGYFHQATNVNYKLIYVV